MLETDKFDRNEQLGFGRYSNIALRDLPLNYLYRIAMGWTKLSKTVVYTAQKELDCRGEDYLIPKSKKRHRSRRPLKQTRKEINQWWAANPWFLAERTSLYGGVHIDQAVLGYEGDDYWRYADKAFEDACRGNISLEQRVDIINRAMEIGYPVELVAELFDSTVVPAYWRVPNRLSRRKKWSPIHGRCTAQIDGQRCGKQALSVDGQQVRSPKYRCAEHLNYKYNGKPNAKLTESEARKIKIDIKNSGLTQRALSKKWGISQSIISNIKNGYIWGVFE